MRLRYALAAMLLTYERAGDYGEIGWLCPVTEISTFDLPYCVLAYEDARKRYGLAVGVETLFDEGDAYGPKPVA